VATQAKSCNGRLALNSQAVEIERNEDNDNDKDGEESVGHVYAVL
jgi:hypothetical protein